MAPCREGGGCREGGRVMTASAARATVPGALRRARDAVTPATRAFLERLDDTSAAIAAYHLGWTDAAGVPTRGGGGKGLRPAPSTLSAQTSGAPPRAGCSRAGAA